MMFDFRKKNEHFRDEVCSSCLKHIQVWVKSVVSRKVIFRRIPSVEIFEKVGYCTELCSEEVGFMKKGNAP